jgi:DNA-binding CsgD family transcriptional regulator
MNWELFGDTECTPLQPNLRGICSRLTDREAEIALLLRKRLPVVQIGALLGISPRTAERYVYHIYEKTNAKNRAELLCRRVRMSAIADQLRISRRTVESHAMHIYRKLHFANREDLIRDIAGEPR